MRSLLLLMCLGLGLSLHAQVFDAGVQGGFSATQVDGDAISGFNKAGLFADAFVRANLSETISVKMELGYIGKGSRKPRDPDQPEEDNWGYTFRYVELPILVEYNLDPVRIQAGPYAGYMIQGNQLFNGNTLEVVNPPLNAIEIGFAAGAEYYLNDKAYILARYSQSLSAVRSAPASGGVTRFYDRRMINLVLQFGMGVVFGSN